MPKSAASVLWMSPIYSLFPGALAQSLGRLGNFINGELMGRVIQNESWQWLGVDFGDGLLRYPSPLFQSIALLVNFLILLFIFNQKPKPGTLLASYLMMNGGFRLVTELFREPDTQIGFLIGHLTLGQILSVGVMGVGVCTLGFSLKFNKST
ncbi:prolipoprotein diacylglyceryl transferase [Candidatus Peregrinibacteria bacterium]|nr:MAG: prolipoprotein diacylglyceryl transferase [Candidatus Peregrinibacteria bacterium]